MSNRTIFARKKFLFSFLFLLLFGARSVFRCRRRRHNPPVCRSAALHWWCCLAFCVIFWFFHRNLSISFLFFWWRKGLFALTEIVSMKGSSPRAIIHHPTLCPALPGPSLCVCMYVCVWVSHVIRPLDRPIEKECEQKFAHYDQKSWNRNDSFHDWKLFSFFPAAAIQLLQKRARS